ncbi:MAG TPA: MerR family transcriptional regulator [Candidatus Eisenbergiella pullicola]|nr:MerR family transcriptional regulator [Candidatus Eisenbergiella pullicola]
MTIYEASERYNIPMDILREYESWELGGAVNHRMSSRQYDDSDLERLSLIMTLHDVGFQSPEIETYMRMLLKPEGTQKQRMRMLDQKRDDMLDEIHFREKQLERLDFLRHHIRKQQESNQNEQVHKYFSHMETEV